MKYSIALLTIVWAFVVSGFSYAQKPNVLLICVDDLRPELNCFGVDYIHSPNIDALASRGTSFYRHYVQAPTCGASRYTLLTGQYGGASNGALFARAKQIRAGKEVDPSMPAYFRNHGYTTVSVGKVSHHPGGHGGSDWNKDGELEMPNSWDRTIKPEGAWQHPRGWMHGLANGEIRKKAGDMDVFQAIEGPDSIYPDGLSIEQGLNQLRQLSKDDTKPFFLAVGILRPHLPFGAPEKYLEPYQNLELPSIEHPEKPEGKTTWHGSGEFMKYNRWGRNPNSDPEFATLVRKHYAACVSYADAQVGKLIQCLKDEGEFDNTIIVLWGDHGWHLGEHAIWGKHSLFEESLRSPLIISKPGGSGYKVNSIVETLDVFPTLCDLTGLKRPEYVQGRSLARSLDGDELGPAAAFSYAGKGKTIRTDQFRMIEHKDGFVELYDMSRDGSVTTNVASENADIVSKLKARIAERFSGK